MKKYIADEKKIRKLMIDKNIKSINELSKLSGISRPKLYEYLNGNTPMQNTFVRLADFFDLKPDELILEVDNIED